MTEAPRGNVQGCTALVQTPLDMPQETRGRELNGPLLSARVDPLALGPQPLDSSRMAKRGAEKQLTQNNVDEDERSDEARPSPSPPCPASPPADPAHSPLFR